MLFAVLRHGGKSIRLFPHRYEEDDRYHVGPAREGPYIPLGDERDIPDYLANGYLLGMSNSAENCEPTMIRPELIKGWEEVRQGLLLAETNKERRPRRVL